jgi:plasmid stabilization system protein ParE
VAHVTWTAEAQRWLQEIYDYIARDNPDAAYRTITAIHERTQILPRFPQIGTQYRSAPHIRILIESNYRIAYLLKPDGTIDILGVFHGALPIERYLP